MRLRTPVFAGGQNHDCSQTRCDVYSLEACPVVRPGADFFEQRITHYNYLEGGFA